MITWMIVGACFVFPVQTKDYGTTVPPPLPSYEYTVVAVGKDGVTAKVRNRYYLLGTDTWDWWTLGRAVQSDCDAKLRERE
tara:strand:+ start:1438 stop:1680 length:243 start_codon:yes stop_codon:yes gene_type:complete